MVWRRVCWRRGVVVRGTFKCRWTNLNDGFSGDETGEQGLEGDSEELGKHKEDDSVMAGTWLTRGAEGRDG